MGIALLATFSAVGFAQANAPVRYALIVGNDVGVTDAGTEFYRLLHAERDAAALRAQLVRFGAFPDDTDHVVMVLGKGRDAILAAARRLAEQRRQDRERWGDRQTLFAFFFTGHGLEGKLLPADEPLTGADLAGIYRGVGATFSFDSIARQVRRLRSGRLHGGQVRHSPRGPAVHRHLRSDPTDVGR